MADVLCVKIQYTVCLFWKQKTAYEMRISGWGSDVCSSDLTKFTHGTPHERQIQQSSRSGKGQGAGRRAFANRKAVRQGLDHALRRQRGRTRHPGRVHGEIGRAHV